MCPSKLRCCEYVSQYGLKIWLSVKEALTDSNFDVDSTQYIVNALEIWLTCNNS